MVDHNPFELVYSALWDMILAHPYFQTVPPGNVIRFDDKTSRDPFKKVVSASDLPEIILTLDASTANLINTSDTSTCTRSYSWQLSSGDYRYIESLSKLEWSLLCAMVNWPKKLCALKWAGQNFVKRCALASGTTGISDATLNRNIQGWSAIWRADVEMHFSTAAMLKELG